MKKLEHVSYNELDAAAVKNGYELMDSIAGCLVDSVLYVKPETETRQSIIIAGFETYLNSWSSCLTVYIARTEKDREKLLKQWDKYRDNMEEQPA